MRRMMITTEAFADYTEMLRLDPNNAEAYCNRGNVYDDKHDYDHAIADIKDAIRVSPTYASACTGTTPPTTKPSRPTKKPPPRPKSLATAYCNRGNARATTSTIPEEALSDYN